MKLQARISVIFEQIRQIYGSFRIQKIFEREDLFQSSSYICLLMKVIILKSVLRKKYVITTESNHGFLISNNELNRAFSSLQLVEKWVSDITYIRFNGDWHYLNTILIYQIGELQGGL